MSRTVDSLGTPSGDNWPPDGKHLVTCIGTEQVTSSVKHTPAVEMTFSTPDILYRFTDRAYVTAGAVKRLNLIAQRLCDIDKDFPLPDDNLEAAKMLGRYILENAVDRQVYVVIETTKEEFMQTYGDNVGKKSTIDRPRVTFSGYERADVPAITPEGPTDQEEEDDIPF